MILSLLQRVSLLISSALLSVRHTLPNQMLHYGWQTFPSLD